MNPLDILYIFFCTRTFENEAAFLPKTGLRMDIRTVPMACSSMVKDLFLLKAFEAGADAVTVWVCPEGACRYVEGNLRARKRTERVKSILDDIGLGSRRLTFFNFSPEDRAAAVDILKKIASTLSVIGKNPAGNPHSRSSEKRRLMHAGA